MHLRSAPLPFCPSLCLNLLLLRLETSFPLKYEDWRRSYISRENTFRSLQNLIPLQEAFRETLFTSPATPAAAVPMSPAEALGHSKNEPLQGPEPKMLAFPVATSSTGNANLPTSSVDDSLTALSEPARGRVPSA